jgi:divalent metal cation (Fe/Co/Zn/Cd) transporter
MNPAEDINTRKLYGRALALSWFTVLYNIIEGLISVFFGLQEDTLALFGFGVDSFIETISAFGILLMVYRLRSFGEGNRSKFEKTALLITGWCFMALSAVLLAGGIINFITDSKPDSTLAGVVITSISIIVMLILVAMKRKTGKQLKSEPILADANCSLVCVYMSVVVLLSSLMYELFNLGWIDLAGTAGIIYFSVKEGLEAFEKARSGAHCSCHDCSND